MRDSGVGTYLHFDNFTNSLRLFFNAPTADGLSTTVYLLATDPGGTNFTTLTAMASRPADDLHISVMPVPRGVFGDTTMLLALQGNSDKWGAADTALIVLYDDRTWKQTAARFVAAVTPFESTNHVSQVYSAQTSAIISLYHRNDGTVTMRNCTLPSGVCADKPLHASISAVPNFVVQDGSGDMLCVFYDLVRHETFAAQCLDNQCVMVPAATALTASVERVPSQCIASSVFL
jgi:hypothetical protein